MACTDALRSVIGRAFLRCIGNSTDEAARARSTSFSLSRRAEEVRVSTTVADRGLVEAAPKAEGGLAEAGRSRLPSVEKMLAPSRRGVPSRSWGKCLAQSVEGRFVAAAFPARSGSNARGAGRN